MKRAKEQYRDRRGIAFADRHTLVAPRVADWPKYPPRVKDDKDKNQRWFHETINAKCWLCGKWSTFSDSPGYQLHHMASGSRGRSHERELFTMLCVKCHVEITPADLGALLWAKWRYDNEYCDWELLTIRHGFHLPELIVPAWAESI